MAKVQGDFGSASAGQRAVDALAASGVPRDSIRVWNLVPEGRPARTGGSATVGGAVAGTIFGGAQGLVGGALIGAALDESADEGPRLPSPAGVRVVVDDDPEGSQEARDILTSCGAANIVSLP